MLVRFSIENWMSFREKATLSMVATKERQHGSRVPVVKKYQTRLLPVASIYGGNASGKTNFFKAMSFVKQLIVRGTSLDADIPVEPFRLDNRSSQMPSRFQIEILVGNDIYDYSFSLTRKKVVEEKLLLVGSASEKVLFHRQNGMLTTHSSLSKNQRLHFAFEGTRDTQLFLTNSVHQKIDEFRPVFDWFNETLELVAPDARFASFERFFEERYQLNHQMNQLLSQLDTGIDRLDGEVVPLESVKLTEQARLKLNSDLKEGESVRLVSETLRDRLVVTRQNGELIVKKMVTYHRHAEQGRPVKFDMQSESDGTQRVIDLLPALIDLSRRNSNRVYLIDELDRSLHSLLSRQLLTTFLESCSQTSRTQLLFTNHDLLLMDQGLFRRDEMWVVERGEEGSTKLFSFSDFKDVRYDKEIRKSYLQGRLGGIPRFFSNQLLSVAEGQEE